MEYWLHKGSLVGDNPIAAMNETAGNAVPGLTLPIFATMIEAISWHKIFVGLLFHRERGRPMMFMRTKQLGAARLPKESRLVRVIERSRQAMHKHLDELELALSQSSGPWIVGNQFTLADVSMLVILERLREVDWLGEFLIDARPLVTTYWQMLKTRPSYHTAITSHTHETVTAGLARVVALKAESKTFYLALHGRPNP